MKELTSTKREFTALARRLYRRGPLSANSAFRGVIGRGFGIWIREHWGLSSPGLFRPVERAFQTQKKPFALLSWPQFKRAGETNYTFSPTIHLTCFPQQTNNSFFDLDATGVFQTLTLKQPAGAREEFVRNVLVERALPEKSIHWLSSLCNLRVLCASVVMFLRNSEPQRNREHRGFTEKVFYSTFRAKLVEETDRRTREYRFLERIFHTFNRHSDTRRQSTRLKEFFSALLSSFSQTVGEVTPSRDIERSLRSDVQRFNNSTSFRRDFSLVLAHSSNGDTADKTVSFGRFSTPGRMQGTTNLHTRLNHQFLIAVKTVQGESKFAYGPNVFTTLALNFAAPKVSEMELTAKRISQFVSSPELTHIKKQQAISQETINALRAERTPYVESKPVAMPVMPSIEQITNQVRTQLERDLRIERERRGL